MWLNKMKMVTIRDQEFRQIIVRDSYTRRAQQFKNKIISNLKKFGITEDDIEVPLEKIVMKKAQATASWFLWDEHLFFSYNGSDKYVENLAMVCQVIEHFMYLLGEEKITQDEFIKIFAEDVDIIEQRKKARETLGVHEDSTDFKEMHANYKKLSKEHHPDTQNGDTEEFKRINVAHKILRKELEHA